MRKFDIAFNKYMSLLTESINDGPAPVAYRPASLNNWNKLPDDAVLHSINPEKCRNELCLKTYGELKEIAREIRNHIERFMHANQGYNTNKDYMTNIDSEVELCPLCHQKPAPKSVFCIDREATYMSPAYSACKNKWNGCIKKWIDEYPECENQIKSDLKFTKDQIFESIKKK